jgi:plastocyanin
MSRARRSARTLEELVPLVPRRRGSALGASIAISLLVLVALATVAAPVLAAGHAVAIRDSSFGPSSITIRKGDSITWTNRGSTNHNVTFDSFASDEQMEPGLKYSHTFRSAGTFRYTCTLHGFTGKVVVTGAATPKPTKKPTPKPTAKPTARATAAPAASPTTSPADAASPSTVALSSPSPGGPTSTAALGAVAPSPSAGGAAVAEAGSDGSPAGSTGPAIVLLVGLVAAGAVGLGVLARRRR